MEILHRARCLPNLFCWVGRRPLPLCQEAYEDWGAEEDSAIFSIHLPLPIHSGVLEGVIRTGIPVSTAPCSSRHLAGLLTVLRWVSIGSQVPMIHPCSGPGQPCPGVGSPDAQDALSILAVDILMAGLGIGIDTA